MASRLRRLVPGTVNDVLDGHVKLDLECLDRLYLHGYLHHRLNPRRPPASAPPGSLDWTSTSPRSAPRSRQH